MSVILIGFMGAGKSTVARLLSEDFIDLDKLIEQQIQMPISQFFKVFGEIDFRQVEHEVFKSAILMDFVIATGGGIVENEQNRELLAQQKQVIYLRANFESLLARVKADEANVRPLAQDISAMKSLYERRLPFYEAAADLIIETAGKSPAEIAQLILESQ